MVLSLTHLKYSLYQRNSSTPHEINAFVLSAVFVEEDGLDPHKDHDKHVKTYLKLKPTFIYGRA